MIVTPELDLLYPYRIYKVIARNHASGEKSTLYVCGGILIHENKILEDLIEFEISNGTDSGSGMFLIEARGAEIEYMKIINNHFICIKKDTDNNQSDLKLPLY